MFINILFSMIKSRQGRDSVIKNTNCDYSVEQKGEFPKTIPKSQNVFVFIDRKEEMKHYILL